MWSCASPPSDFTERERDALMWVLEQKHRAPTKVDFFLFSFRASAALTCVHFLPARCFTNLLFPSFSSLLSFSPPTLTFSFRNLLPHPSCPCGRVSTIVWKERWSTTPVLSTCRCCGAWNGSGGTRCGRHWENMRRWTCWSWGETEEWPARWMMPS